MRRMQDTQIKNPVGWFKSTNKLIGYAGQASLTKQQRLRCLIFVNRVILPIRIPDPPSSGHKDSKLATKESIIRLSWLTLIHHCSVLPHGYRVRVSTTRS